MIAYVFLIIIFVILPVSAFWAVKTGKITDGTEPSTKKTNEQNKGKSDIVKGIVWFIIGFLIFYLESKLGFFNELPGLFEASTDVNSIAGPLSAMFNFPLLIGSLVVVGVIVFCFIMSIKYFHSYYSWKNNQKRF